MATIVVACGTAGTARSAGSDRRPGSSSGEWAVRYSTNDEVPGVVKKAGGRLECSTDVLSVVRGWKSLIADYRDPAAAIIAVPAGRRLEGSDGQTLANSY
jgi:hypothetical protein